MQPDPLAERIATKLPTPQQLAVMLESPAELGPGIRSEAAALIREQAGRIAELEEAAEKLQRFKDWVHAFLDGKGVPHHPPGTHGAAGCRIGDRMDWVWSERDALRLRVVRMHADKCTVENCVLDGGPEHEAAFTPATPQSWIDAPPSRIVDSEIC